MTEDFGANPLPAVRNVAGFGCNTVALKMLRQSVEAIAVNLIAHAQHQNMLGAPQDRERFVNSSPSLQAILPGDHDPVER